MNFRQKTISLEVKKAIDEILRKNLVPYGYQNANIEVRADHSGDDSIFIDAFYEPRNVPIDTDILANLYLELPSILQELGEDRFPYLKHHFEENQRIKGFS